MLPEGLGGVLPPLLLHGVEDFPVLLEKTGITRSSLYRHLPPRPVETHTAVDIPDASNPGLG